MKSPRTPTTPISLRISTELLGRIDELIRTSRRRVTRTSVIEELCARAFERADVPDDRDHEQVLTQAATLERIARELRERLVLVREGARSRAKR